MKKTLFRAAKDDYVDTGYSFATSRATAESYLDNPGFGGAKLYRTRITYGESEFIDLTGVSVSELAKELGMGHPGAIGVDEWIPRTPKVLDALRDMGFLWALVLESFPEETTTWIWCGTGADNEPELEEL
jgi:hypothetical protein